MSEQLADAGPVGRLLARELDERGWSQADFADVLGRPAQFVSEIISGKKEITRESAAQIAAAFDMSAQFWLNYQDRYHLNRHANNAQIRRQLDTVRLRSRFKELAPVAILQERGFLRGSTPEEQRDELKALFEIDDIYDEPAVLIAARRSVQDESLTPTQLAWVACARREARRVRASKYDPDKLRDLAGRLAHMIRDPADFAKLPELFRAAGVRLVYVRAFPGSKMDGCSFLLDGSPVIAISGRGRRMDKVLFTILHEIAHILLGDLDKSDYVIDDQSTTTTLGSEQQANDLASHLAFPKPLPKFPERIGAAWINRVSREQMVHPILVVGRLQKDGKIPWKSTLVRDAPTLSDTDAPW